MPIVIEQPPTLARMATPLFDDFDNVPTSIDSSPWTFSATLAGAIAARNGEPNHPGIWRLSPAATLLSGIALRRDIASRLVNTIRFDLQFVFRSIYVPVPAEGGNMRIGFSDANTAVPTDGLHLYQDDTSTFFQMAKYVGGVATVVPTAVPLDTNWHSGRIIGSEGSGASFFLDGAFIGLLPGPLGFGAGNLLGVSVSIRRAAAGTLVATPGLDIDAISLDENLNRMAA